MISVSIDPNLWKTRKFLTTLIPGRIYKDDKDVEFLFVGYGTVERTGSLLTGETPSWKSRDNRYLYMKKADVDKKITRGQLTPDLKEYNPFRKGVDFGSTFFFSTLPRRFVEEIGVAFPDDYFLSFAVTDHTLEKETGKLYYYKFTTTPK